MRVTGTRIEFYRDADKRHRWRAWSGGNIVADSGQSYSRRIDALHACRRLYGAVWVPEGNEGRAPTFAGWFDRIAEARGDEWPVWESIPVHFLKADA